jgi:hypothetical protein
MVALKPVALLRRNAFWTLAKLSLNTVLRAKNSAERTSPHTSLATRLAAIRVANHDKISPRRDEGPAVRSLLRQPRVNASYHRFGHSIGGPEFENPRLTLDQSSHSIVTAVPNLCQFLDREVPLEGTHTIGQRIIGRMNGCDIAPGRLSWL